MLNRLSYFARAVLFFGLLFGGQAIAASSILLGWPVFATLAIGLAFALAASGVYASTAYAAKDTIDAITLHARQMSEGDLSRDVDVVGSDATKGSLRSLKALQDKLRETIGAVRTGSSEVSTASNEIATGNQDLSHRTEQTASDLQQTASSLSQLTANVRQSADAAAQANQLASSATQVARRGGEVVSQVVATMEEINSSSKKIADIIGTIDGIAFQTNILALNAAVEAARAGEQGRGFAVVAGEVRSLAQRSAEAAKEIKSLIGTSVDKVETGSKLVEDAGSTMNEIVNSVQRVTDIIGEISAAALEQSQGIGQVNEAVTRLDQMTQQNAALVEESAAAAESLKDQAHRMTSVVANYRIDSKTPVSGFASAPAAHPAAAAKVIAKAAAYRPAAKPVLKSVPKSSAKSAKVAKVVKPVASAAYKPVAAIAYKPAATRAVAAPVAPAPAPSAASGASDDWESF